ncbi:unnamed protein product [Lactuca saligna]|uniref:Uncharacterized protein n=1 Tax=Lactuca saligna TaxID=75948 RepID=A0AA35VMK1_LACSI|nr:unnamed protein product [Lactuca saligna]
MKLPISQELIEELQIYFMSFGRVGYGESDPHPKRPVQYHLHLEGYLLEETERQWEEVDPFQLVVLEKGCTLISSSDFVSKVVDIAVKELIAVASNREGTTKGVGVSDERQGSDSKSVVELTNGSSGKVDGRKEYEVT